MDVPMPLVEQRVGVPVPWVQEEILEWTQVIPEQRLSEPFVDMPVPWIQEEVVEVAVQEFWNTPVRVELSSAKFWRSPLTSRATLR